jgi:hypothetical protein
MEFENHNQGNGTMVSMDDGRLNRPIFQRGRSLELNEIEHHSGRE